MTVDELIDKLVKAKLRIGDGSVPVVIADAALDPPESPITCVVTADDMAGSYILIG